MISSLHTGAQKNEFSNKIARPVGGNKVHVNHAPEMNCLNICDELCNENKINSQPYTLLSQTVNTNWGDTIIYQTLSFVHTQIIENYEN